MKTETVIPNQTKFDHSNVINFICVSVVFPNRKYLKDKVSVVIGQLNVLPSLFIHT